MPIFKSKSYPERLVDQQTRLNSETIQEYKMKDHSVMEHLANIDNQVNPNIAFRVINFLLERNEEAERTDQFIHQRSYAGFYYFFKWLSRTLFLTIFTTLGNISGKEVSCLIETQEICEESVLVLLDLSPSIIGWIMGSVVGLITGQWIGRLLWDYFIDRTIVWYTECSKTYLLFIALVLYTVNTVSLGVIFYYFVPIENEWASAGIGSSIGLVCAVVAYYNN